MIDREHAQLLWENLRSALLDSKKMMLEIIETQAWKPLGYESLQAAWMDRMSDIDLATTTITHLVYAMLAEGSLDVEICAAVKGIGPETVALLRRQRDNGVPPDLAVLRQRTTRKPIGDGGTLFLHVGREKLEAWTLVAEKRGSTVADMALEFLEVGFAD